LSVPHGGKLVNRVLREDQRERVQGEIDELPKIGVSDETVSDIRNIAEGAFSPLEGFLGREDYLSVLYERRLANGLPWTIPIVLDASKQRLSTLGEGDDAVLADKTGQPIALLHISDVFSFDRWEMAGQVFGTVDESHPGVAKAFHMGELLLGGKIDLINRLRSPYESYYLSPAETRAIFEGRGWKTVAGFQTRNVPHLGHEYIQKIALTFVDGILIQPIIGRKKIGDFKDEVILAAYQVLIRNYYLEERTALGILQTEMRYAGPREAIFHAIVRKNFGCTHFIVGRDHAGVGNYYPPYAAHEIFREFPDLGITPLFFPSVFFCKRCEGIANDKTCPHGDECHLEFSGTKMRDAINKRKTMDLMIRPEVAEVLMKWEKPFVEAENLG